jgi:hypothetical protein
MRILRLNVVLFFAIAAIFACGGQADPAKRPEAVAAEKVQQALDAGKMNGESSTGVVEVLPTGSEFDPPVRVDQIPTGAWYCDMGTVHYARLTKGDGRCPRCGMNLTRQGG